MTTRIIKADGPTGPLCAAIDPETREPEPQVAGGAMGAHLHPFRDEAAAVAALKAAGGKISKGGKA
jgi:hypothetical protein